MNKPFKVDYTTKNFSIVIDVYENGLTFQVNEGYTMPNYHEMLGALHHALYGVMENQRKEARKAFAKTGNKALKNK